MLHVGMLLLSSVASCDFVNPGEREVSAVSKGFHVA